MSFVNPTARFLESMGFKQGALDKERWGWAGEQVQAAKDVLLDSERESAKNWHDDFILRR